MPRTAAMAMALTLHLGLLLTLLQPAAPLGEKTRPAQSTEVPAMRALFVTVHPVVKRPAQVSPPPPRLNTAPRSMAVMRRLGQMEPLPLKSAATGLPASAITSPTADEPYPAIHRQTSSADDGGFHERLLDAQRGARIGSIPGSDGRLVPGIELTDPMHQGIGAVMRNGQRLFGITNRHCIDVQALSQLSPAALSMKHLSPADVQKMSEKYDCNSPLGLHF
ncbi:hypothetical protein [Dyella sp.]|uniref:hypothetical protein n=1 Tax=Dyella sp. TaxID=1869338 RepID=UPI002ED0E9D6